MWWSAALGVALLLVAAPVGAAEEGTFGQGSWKDAQVRVLHASPDAPAVDVRLDGATAVTGLAFGESTSYLAVPAGTYLVEVVPAGEDGPVVLSAELSVKAGMPYSVLAIGKLAELAPLVLEDRTYPSSRNAHVRFVHASPDAPAVDLASAGGEPLFESVAFGEATNYARVSRGTVDLEARPAGTQTVALAVPDVALKGRTAYTAVAVGLLEDGTLDVVLLKDAGHH